jgi:ubiquitin C-terminal hydrolase
VAKPENSKQDDEDEDMENQVSTNTLTNQDEEMPSEEDQKKEQQPKENFEYKLVGVVVHMGTADAGHYLSYINISRGEKDEESPEWLLTEKEKWLEFNDSAVRSYQ